jgi:hypothetical protein
MLHAADDILEVLRILKFFLQPWGATHSKFGEFDASITGSFWGWITSAHMMHLWFQDANAAFCRRRGIAVEPRGRASAAQPDSGHEQVITCTVRWHSDGSIVTCTVRGSGDGSIGKPPRSGNVAVEPSPEACRHGGLHSQGSGPRPPGGTCEVLNATCRDQLAKVLPLALSQPRLCPHPVWNNPRSKILHRSYKRDCSGQAKS